ncbi:HAD hydrolase family protein [Fluviicola sp.]|jgi:3-deoxy-D-manno-octulosonate 8-phosphate phosphatase (KDO 8-P phosphatase)|uniref:KdsC family phosphatase n=1 Tax=Fluviicola sp. TaxID=1917219 RepID=UPI002825020A|nr:HAD hydrolase family protein [Fluviicola sp.]MDR0802465.1 HAD hydrolase family protein [Fluviicola sp.]
MTSYKERLNNISTFIFDIDGVLTDGTVFPYQGDLLRGLNSKDGYAIQYAVKKGYKVFIITGGNSEPIKNSLLHLGVSEVHLRSSDKVAVYKQLKENHRFQDEEVLYMGDDLPDYQVMRVAGMAACPQDAVIEIKHISHYQSPYSGGKGCARDVIEQTLRVQDNWFHREAFVW